MWKNDMTPRLIDFPYLEPIVEVFRFEELRFNSYPQLPQLWMNNEKVIDKKKLQKRKKYLFSTQTLQLCQRKEKKRKPSG